MGYPQGRLAHRPILLYRFLKYPKNKPIFSDLPDVGRRYLWLDLIHLRYVSRAWLFI